MDKNKQREIEKGLHKGDRRAWLMLYDAYAENLCRNVTRLMGPSCPAIQDIVQETFMQAARSAKNYNSRRGSLSTWLWLIARSKIALYYRKQAPETILLQAKKWWSSLNTEKHNWITAEKDTPPEILQSRELAELVRLTLIELPGEYQTLLLAKYVQCQQISDIAQDLNCSQSAVNSKLARARKAFRNTFKKLTKSIPETKEVSL